MIYISFTKGANSNKVRQLSQAKFSKKPIESLDLSKINKKSHKNQQKA